MSYLKIEVFRFCFIVYFSKGEHITDYWGLKLRLFKKPLKPIFSITYQ